MAELPQPRQVRVADVLVAQTIGMKVEHLLGEITALATSLGTMVTAQQLLSAVLSATWTHAERPLTREEFAWVYDHVESLQTQWEKAQNGDGPEATADAETPVQAVQRRDHWGAKIDDAAFGFGVPQSLREFPPEAIGG